ncbi:hypothetical protein QJV45_16925 [Listeria booriae]|uniref:hypothetical protein n=1 Tax=Listeria booriae TaxID=1552123 RepID=UPI00287FFC61|nr:hypothetical protein [Listeria booriae]MDT0112152.1 hypothetical protein [Listeria booriae]
MEMETINNLKDLEIKMEKNKFEYANPRMDKRSILLHLVNSGAVYVKPDDWKERRLFLISSSGDPICYLDKKRREAKKR